MSGDFQYGPITELAAINPRVNTTTLEPDALVSFIPMSDVSEMGQWTGKQARRLSEVRNGYTAFQEGDVLFAKITPCMENGKGCHAVGLVNGVGFGTTEFHVLRAKPGGDVRFIYHWLHSEALRRKAEAMMTGSAGQQRVPAEFFEQYKIPLLPFSDQRRIAGILDTVDAAIQHTEALIAKLKQVKAGLLHDLLTRGLDEHGQLRDPVAHPEQFKDSPLGRIPREWNIQLVGEVFDMQLGKMLNKAAKTGLNPFPYLANRNVQWDQVDLSDLEWMDFTDPEREKFSLLPGDLLVCEGGEVGRTAMWRGEMENCCFQKAIHRLRPKDSRVVPSYMLRLMRRAVDYGFLTTFTSQTSIAHLTREKFALLPLPLPPTKEQQAIVDIFDAHDARIRAEEAYRDKLTQLKKGLMHDLLTGRVRVKTTTNHTQEANDDQASLSSVPKMQTED